MRVMGIAGVLLAAMTLASCGAGNDAEAGTSRQVVATYGFKICIDGVASPDSWSAAEGLKQTTGFVDTRDPATGALTTAPDGSRPSIVRLTMVFDPSGGDEIRGWVKDVYEGADVRKDMTVEVFDQATRNVVRTFTLNQCFPVGWDFGGLDGKGVVQWTLEVRVNRIEMA